MPPNALVGNRFRIEKLAGSGGMGAVYRALDTFTGESVAIKLVHSSKRALFERFAREVRALAELEHPTIVRYVAHGTTERDEPFLAMEWLNGEDLAARLKRGPLTGVQTLSLARRVADALALAHARRIVHRDLKPSNLFLIEGDPASVKLLDFGIARFDDATRGMTGTGVAIGTPGYMAPEQARGAPAIDARADVFSFGCVLFECLTGRPAFVARHQIALLAKILVEDAPRVRELRATVPQSVDDLVARMLSKNPEARPADGRAMRAELDATSPDWCLDAPSGIGAGSPSVEPRSLTRGERQLVSVVLAGTPNNRSLELATTQAVDSESTLRSVLARKLTPFGAAADWLVDGSALVTITASGAATDQAVRAARAALVMRELLDSTVPIALSTGQAMLVERLPVGEVIDRAARLLGMTENDASTLAEGARPVPGVLVDAVTAGLLPPRFDIRGGPDRFVLTGERMIGDPTRRLLGKPTPFVGRAQEFALLQGALREVIEDEVARAVLVTGAVGSGKSRLREEFVEAARSTGDSLALWIAYGDPMRAGSPLGMLAEALRRACELHEGEPIEVEREKIRARVAANVEPRHTDRVAAFLGEIVGASFAEERNAPLRAARKDPLLMGEQMRRAWLDFIGAETAKRPVLLVLEDLHWGDAPTASFVDLALRELRDRPLLVLALAREEVGATFPKLWSGRALTQLKLADLSHKASAKLARQVLGSSVSDAVIASLVERAAGNPFYLEEIIRAIAEGRGERLPETVLAMVQARLGALDDEARRVLRAASVFGQIFWRGGINALVGAHAHAHETAAAQDWLAELVANEVVAERTNAIFLNEDEFAFRHAIVRDAAYESLTDADRRLGHKLAGDWLERAGERNAGVVADHLERGEEPERAIDWYQRAAVQALDGNDFDAAVAAAERGIECGASGEALGALHMLEAEACLWRADYERAKHSARTALELLGAATPAWYSALATGFAAADKSGDWSVAAALAGELCAREPASDTRPAFASALARCVSHSLSASRTEIATRLLDRLQEIEGLLADDDPALAGKIEVARAMRAYTSGQPEEFLARMTRAAQSFEVAGDVRTACSVKANAGHAHAELGEYENAEQLLRDSLARAVEHRLHNAAAWAKHNLGLVLALRGSFEEAHGFEREAIDAARTQGDPYLELCSRLATARICLLSGDADGAERAARDALADSEPGTEPRAEALATLARAELACGRGAVALVSAQGAWRLLSELAVSSTTDALVRLAYAEALGAAGDVVAAKTAIRDARDALLARARKITEAGRRKSFIENVPEHKETLRRAQEMLG